MNPSDAALALETILVAENEALERHEPALAVALLDRKLAAAAGLSPEDMTLELGERLRTLAGENRRLLAQSIDVQSRIISMVVRAAQSVPPVARYGAAGRGPGHRVGGRHRDHPSGVTRDPAHVRAAECISSSPFLIPPNPAAAGAATMWAASHRRCGPSGITSMS